MGDTLQIFISYRRDDGRNHAAFLYWQLLERLPSTLFLDIESITPGADFKNSLDVALDSCDVLLALIGKAWNGGAGSPPLLERPDDFVRMEISSALVRGTPVIPVLLDGAEMPPAAHLPADLAALSFRHALSLTEETKLQDVARLARELVTLLNRERTHKAGSSSSTLAEDVAHQQRLTRDREEETQIKRLRQRGLRPELVIQEGHSSAVHAVAFHPNGSWVASGSSDYTIRIWEAATGKVIFVLAGHTGSVNAVAFSPDGKLLASGGYDRTVRVWDLSTGDLLKRLDGHSYDTNSVVFSPNGKSILAAGGDIRSWDVETGQLIRRFEEGWFASFSPDGSIIAAPIHDGVLRIWNAQTGSLLRTLQIAGRNSGLPLFAHFSPDSRHILTGCAGSPTVSFWDVASGEPEKTIETDFTGHGVRSAALSHDGKCLAVTDTEQRFQLWNVETCRLDYESQSNDYEAIDSICFDPSGGLIACANRRKAVVLMDRRGSLVRKFDGSPAASTAVGIARDQKTIVVWSGSQSCTIWNAQEERRICEVESYGLRLVRFSFDSRYAVLKNTSNMDATLFETTGRKIADLQAGNGTGNLAFSADNEMLAALRDAVDVLRIHTGRRVRQIRTTDVGIRCIAFNPVNGHLAGGCEGGVIRFWEPESGKQTLNLRGPEADVLALDFNPRFPILASGNSAGNLILWDLASNPQILKSLVGPAEPISHLQFDREGAMIACQNRAVGEITVWDTKDGAVIQTISKCENVEYFEFTESGASLVLTQHSSTDGTTIRVVSVSTGLETGTLKAYRDGHWIAVAHDGGYASSERMPAKVGWRIGDSVFQCASLHEEYRLTVGAVIGR